MKGAIVAGTVQYRTVLHSISSWYVYCCTELPVCVHLLLYCSGGHTGEGYYSFVIDIRYKGNIISYQFFAGRPK